MSKESQAKARARRKAARARFDDLALAATPKRDKTGSFVDRIRQQPADPFPRQVVFEARARQMGWTDVDQCAAQSLGCPEGIAINLAMTGAKDAPQAIARLWTVYTTWDAVEATYARRILGQSRHAKTAKLEMMPEKLEVDHSIKPDLRSDGERDRDASNNWARWRGYLGHLEAYERTALHNANLGRAELHSGQALTAGGRAFIAALERLAVVVEKSSA